MLRVHIYPVSGCNKLVQVSIGLQRKRSRFKKVRKVSPFRSYPPPADQRRPSRTFPAPPRIRAARRKAALPTHQPTHHHLPCSQQPIT